MSLIKPWNPVFQVATAFLPCALCSIINQDDWQGKIIAAGPAAPQTTVMSKDWPIVGGSGVLYNTRVRRFTL